MTEYYVQHKMSFEHEWSVWSGPHRTAKKALKEHDKFKRRFRRSKGYHCRIVKLEPVDAP